jgi:hypothetical protein
MAAGTRAGPTAVAVYQAYLADKRPGPSTVTPATLTRIMTRIIVAS